MNNNIVMRTKSSIEGLINLCRWINHFIPTNTMRMIEIGSFAGDSTEIFCKWFKHVIAIDPWKSNVGDITSSCDMNVIYDRFCKKMAKYPNLNVIKCFSYEIVNNFQDGFFDFIYIDGSHQYFNVLRDISLYRHKVKKGGYLGGHDYRAKFAGVVKAVKEQFGKPIKIFKDTSWIVKI